MRRVYAMMPVLGLLAAGLGCHHIAGKCDCGAHPADAINNWQGPTNPYPYAPVVVPVKPVVPVPVPEKAPEKLPPG